MSAAAENKSARFFLALWPDETVRSRLVDAASLLRQRISGRWTPPEKLHVTLVFLGDVASNRRPEIVRIASENQGRAFELGFDHGEFWPRNGIVCLAPKLTPAALADLVEGLTGRLQEAGFAVEERRYRAHLTLARKGRSDSTALPLPEPINWNVRSFCLVESRAGANGSEYVVLESWMLEDPQSIPDCRSMG